MSQMLKRSASTLRQSFALVRQWPVLVLTVIAVLLSACQEAGQASSKQKNGLAKKRPPLWVETATAQKKAASRAYRRTGILRYRRISRIYNQASGQIEKVGGYEGDLIRAGQLLVSMNNELLKAEIAKAQAQRERAEQRLDRISRLIKTQSASKDELLEARTQLKLSIAELEILNIKLGYTRIIAPFTGVITQRQVEPGEVVARNTHLLTLADPDSMVARITVEPGLLALLAVGEAVDIHFEHRLQDPLSGHIQRIFPDIDNDTGLGTIEVTWKQTPPDALHAGQLVWVTFIPEARERLLIPLKALRRNRHGTFVFTVNDNKAYRTPVQTGEQFDHTIEIIAGLEPEQLVITSGFLGLHSGAPVQISTASNTSQ